MFHVVSNQNRRRANGKFATEPQGYAQFVGIRISQEMLGALKERAAMQGIGYTTLIKQWLAERLRRQR